MNWAHFFLCIGLLIGQLSGWSQTENKFDIPLMRQSTHEYLYTISMGGFSPTGDCPPRIAKDQSNKPHFLDSLNIPDSVTNAFFDQVSWNNCESFYEIQAAFEVVHPAIDSVFESMGLPAYYGLLPLAISGANPGLAYDTDKAGLWQMSYITARKNQLKITAQYDERFHPQLSTLAAAKHLQFLQAQYLNNPVLVVTAFYTSVPFVNKHLKAHPKVNQHDFYASLPTHVQHFLGYYKAWADWYALFDIKEQNHPNKYTAVNFPDTIAFSALADFLEVTPTQLAIANPVWTSEVYYPNTAFGLNVPAKQAKTISKKYEEFLAHQAELKAKKERELAELKKRMEQGIPDLTKNHAVTYKVKSGDVLGTIAAKHHVKVSQIKLWNNLKSDRINIGQELTIYVPNDAPVKVVTEEKAPEPATKTAQPGTGTPTIYVVKSGESLWLIAKKFPGVSAENIMEWNGISDKIDVGQKLKIYPPNP